MSEVQIIVSGPVGSGKSALLGEIEIMCKALGIPARYADEAAAQSEKNMTHSDWTSELEMYKPSVVLVEGQPWRAPQAATTAIQHAEAVDDVPVGSVLGAGQILALERRSDMTNNEALRFGRAIEGLVLRTVSPAATTASAPETEPDIFDAVRDYRDRHPEATTASASESDAFSNYFCMTLSCDGSESQELIDACRAAAHDAWMERSRRAALARAPLPAPDAGVNK